MPKEVNSFTGGVDRDSDLQIVPNNKARFMQNMRNRSVDGKTFVVVTVGGMTNEFQLTDGFLPLGYAEHEGVAFIFSHNPTTGEGEIGTYPSPRTPASPLYPSYEPVYRPLQNWTGAVDPDPEITPNPIRLDFRTDLFQFDCAYPIEAEAQLSYDGSVILWWTDFKNPLRWLNTGFIHATGAYNDEYYWTGNLINKINVFSETCSHPRVSLFNDVQVNTGGNLQGGNYFFFVRYADIAFNYSSYLCEVGPIQITIDDTDDGVTMGGVPAFEVCGKQITIKLSNIDSTTYPYIELAVAYFHNDTFNLNKIVKFYPTIGGSSELTITINGTEELADLTIAELLRTKGELDVPKTITQIDGRLWGGNWKKSFVNYVDLENIAQEVLVKPPDPAELLPEATIMSWASDQPPSNNQNYQKTLNTNGYFRGESYPFAISFVLKDGRTTQPFPVKGYDAWYGNPGITNNKGILRFPSNNNTGYEYVDQFNPLQPGIAITKTMGVKFDTTNIPYANWSQWAKDNICGFYLMRGERKPNLVYQGIGTRVYGDVDNSNPGVTDMTGLIWADGRRPYYNAVAAVLAGIFPAPCANDCWPLGSRVCDNGGGLSLVTETINYTTKVFAEIGYSSDKTLIPLRHNASSFMTQFGNFARGSSLGVALAVNNYAIGLFSTDHFFKRLLNDAQYKMVLQGYGVFRIQNNDTFLSNSRRLCAILTDMAGFTSWSAETSGIPTNAPSANPQTSNIPEATSVGFGAKNFNSYYYEGNQENTGSGNEVFLFGYVQPQSTGAPTDNAETGNKEMKQRNYIGIDCAQGANGINFFTDVTSTSFMQDFSVSLIDYMRLPIINIYNREVDPASGFNIETEYSPELTQYYRISDILPVAAWDGLGVFGQMFFHGDCFTNRVYHRQLCSGGYHDNEYTLDQWDNTGYIFDASCTYSNSDTGTNYYYKYGNINGSIQECSINTGMRLETGISGTLAGAGKYYPKTARSNPFFFSTENGQYAEETAVNGGYDRQLGLIGTLGFDVLIPFRTLEYITRIWCSNQHLPNNLSNAYLIWDVAAYVDFDTSTGPINKIVGLNDTLLSVQASSIWIHRINREALLPDNTSEGRLLLGRGDLIPSKPAVLSPVIGTQHQRSVIRTTGGVWGYDQKNRKIWNYSGGGLRLASDDLTSRSDVTNCSEFLGNNSDILNVYPDAPVCSGGVVAFWDPRNHEVGWTWRIYYQPTPEFGITTFAETLIYNEQYNLYQHKRTHHSPFYVTIGEDLYSAHPDYMGPNAQETGPIPFFRHDNPTAPYLEFYGGQEFAGLGWVHNTGAVVTKLYNGIAVHANDVPMSYMLFQTKYQEALLNPFLTAPYWLRPIHKEHSWRLPVPMATSIFPGGSPAEFFVNSRMKGRYMYAEAQWASPLEVSVDSITTTYTPSIR